jgi:membrane protease subunit (stomatin/prohibitin family)
MGEQVRQGLARLREELEATQAGCQASRAQHETNGLCSDCPEKDAEAHHHSVSEERKADCPECIDRANYA